MNSKYMVTCVPGAEAILKEEIQALIPHRSNMSVDRGKVFFDSDSELDEIMRLRCADNIYGCIGKFNIGPHKEDLKGFYTNIAQADYSRVRRRKPCKIIVSASRLGKHTYSRFDLSNTATAALQSLGCFIPGDEKSHDIAFRVDVKDHVCLLSVQLTSSEFRFRGGEFCSTKGGIRPSVAHCLVRISQPKNTDVFYDPFCGAGTIPYERASFTYKRIFASDIDGEVVNIARGNLKNDIVLFRSDATDTKIKSESIDTVVTNLPWGKQIVSADLAGLYIDFAKELRRVLKGSGKAVILTDQHKLLQSACGEWDLNLSRLADFSLHGLHPSVFILTRE